MDLSRSGIRPEDADRLANGVDSNLTAPDLNQACLPQYLESLPYRKHPKYLDT